MSNLDKCVEIAEMSAFKLTSDPYQPDLTPYYKRVKTKYEIAKEGFPKFKELPAELRSKVWQSAMPPYGIYTALMRGREEPRPQQPPPPAPMTFRLLYHLEPVPRDQQDDELRTRLHTMRAIQRTNSEAASEVQRAFPTTINCTDGKLRFNAEHDILSLSDKNCPFHMWICERFERYSQGAVVFADDWHKIPRRMVLSNRRLWSTLQSLDFMPRFYKCSRLNALGNPPHSEFVEGFVKFLTDCTGLKSFGFIFSQLWHATSPGPQDLGSSNYEFLRFCHPAPIMKGAFYVGDGLYWPGGFISFLEGLRSLEALARGPRPGQGLPHDWNGLKFGRPELQHLDFEALVSVDVGFHDRMKRTVRQASEGETRRLEFERLDSLLDSVLLR